MNDGNDEHVVAADTIDEPIAVDEALADRVVSELGNDAAGVREALERACRIADLVDHGPSVGGRVAADVFGNGVDIIERGR